MTTEQIHDSRSAFAKFWKEDSGWYEEGAEGLAEHVLADKAFNAGWQACEAQHKQKVRDLTAYLGQCASWDSTDLAQIINKHFGE